MSLSDEDKVTGFSIGQKLGMFVVVEVSALSGLAILALVFYKLLLTLRRLRKSERGDTRKVDPCDSSLFLSLMTGEMIRAIGATISIRWVLDGLISEGKLCVAQGYLALIGTNVIDFSTLFITVHTFSVLVLRWSAPRHIAKVFTAIVWVIVILITVITHAVHNNIMGPTNFWCWIPSPYNKEKILTMYLWMWLIGIASGVAYGIMYLVVLDYIVVENGFHWQNREKRLERQRKRRLDEQRLRQQGHDANEDDDREETEAAREMRKLAKQLLLYPLVYLACIIPLSFARWFYFLGYTVPAGFTLLARTLYSMSGMFNVILFFTTRYDLVAGVTPSSSGPSAQDGAENPAKESRTTATPRQSPIKPRRDGWSPNSSENEHEKVEYPSFRMREPHQQVFDPYSPTHEYDRGRKITPMVASGRNPSSSEHRAQTRSKNDDVDEEDFGRLPG